MFAPGTEIDNIPQIREGEREPSKPKENHQENRHKTGAITLQLQKAASESGLVLPGSPTQPPPQLGEKKNLWTGSIFNSLAVSEAQTHAV